MVIAGVVLCKKSLHSPKPLKPAFVIPQFAVESECSQRWNRTVLKLQLNHRFNLPSTTSAGLVDVNIKRNFHVMEFYPITVLTTAAVVSVVAVLLHVVYVLSEAECEFKHQNSFTGETVTA